MWTSVSVSLSDVLEVRGTHLKEHEAWAILLQIGQILEGSEENRAVTPDGVQLELNGFIYLDSSKRSSCDYSFQRPADGTINFTLSTLAMTMQWCLQYGPKERCTDEISEDLQSILLLIHNAKSTKNLQYYIEKHYRHSLTARGASGMMKNPLLSIQKMYQSILGSSSMALGSVPHIGLQVEPSPMQSPGEITDIKIENPLPHHHESIWKCSESPIKVEIQHNGQKNKDMLTVLVQFVNGKKVRADVNGRQTSCGVLLETCVSKLLGPVDHSLFGLAVNKDGEYIFLNAESKLISALSYFTVTNKRNLMLRLKFIPRDFQSDRNRELLHLIYLQTRSDIDRGRILCHNEQALHMAALALQYENGDYQVSIRCFLAGVFTGLI